MNRKKVNACVVIIILFHAVGLAGFLVPALRPLFLKIVPFHILLMFAVVVYSHKRFNAKFLAFIALTFSLGFAAEWAGVHQHVIFGDYAYGKTLGTKLWDIPLTIGINWFLLIYAAGVLMQFSRIGSAIIRVTIGTLVLVALDLLIEPVAVKFNYWHWRPHAGAFAAPLENYVGWLVVCALMLALFENMKFTKQSKVGVVLLVTQFVFFGLLSLVK